MHGRMISHAHQCIFVHQRKCAGSSIITSFGFGLDSPDWHFANDGVLSPDWSANPELIHDYFKFAVIRNPWDRFISGWKYCESTRDRSLMDVLTKPPREGHDYRHLTRPQHLTLFGSDGKLAVDYLIRFEALDEGYREVCRRIGKADDRLARVNVARRSFWSRRPVYRKLFDAPARDLFEKIFSGDIRRFGYHF